MTTTDPTPYQRPTALFRDSTPTEKFFLVSESLDRGQRHVEHDGEYTITVERASKPRHPGWYLVATSADPVASYWTGEGWAEPPLRWTLGDPIVVDRLLTVTDVLTALTGGQGDAAIAARLVQVFG